MVTFLLALWWDIGSKYIQLEQVFPFWGVCVASMCNAVADSGASYVMWLAGHGHGGKGWGFPPPGRCGYFVSPGQMLDVHDRCLAHAGVVGLWRGRLPIASGPFRLLNFDCGIPFPSAGVGMHLSLRRVVSQCSGEAVDDQGLLGPFSGCLWLPEVLLQLLLIINYMSWQIHAITLRHTHYRNILCVCASVYCFSFRCWFRCSSWYALICALSFILISFLFFFLTRETYREFTNILLAKQMCLTQQYIEITFLLAKAAGQERL